MEAFVVGEFPLYRLNEIYLTGELIEGQSGGSFAEPYQKNLDWICPNMK
jgi:hypothetical protein